MKTMIILITIMVENLILSDAYRGSPPYANDDDDNHAVDDDDDDDEEEPEWFIL